MRNLPNGGLALTSHAMKQCQRRGISRRTLDVLYQYGKCSHVREGLSFAMDKRSRDNLKKDLGKGLYQDLESQLNTYIVIVGGCVITVAHRYRRLNR